MKKFIAFIMIVLLFASCSKKQVEEKVETTKQEVSKTKNEEVAQTTKATEHKELKEITFVLDWTPNTNHTGVYVADKMGFFEEEGIKITIVQPPEDGAAVMVGSGQAQFGVSFQDFLIYNLISENKMGIEAVAAILQHNTSGILSRKGEGMDSPKGMEGKKYATWDMPIEKAMIEEVVTASGGDYSKVELIPSTVYDAATALESDSVDAIWVFYGWDGIDCEIKGIETDYFNFADISPELDFYTPVIIANTDFLENDTEIAKAFMRAVSKGYEYAAKNPEEAAKIIVEAVPELSEMQVVKSQEYLSNYYLDDNGKFGTIDGSRWDRFYKWLFDKGLIDVEQEPEAGFTNDYLE